MYSAYVASAENKGADLRWTQSDHAPLHELEVQLAMRERCVTVLLKA